MQPKLGDVIKFICNHSNAPFLRDIHHSLNREMSNRCHSVKMTQYMFRRRTSENNKTSIETRNSFISLSRLNCQRGTIVQCLNDMVDTRFHGAGIMDDQLFAIDVSHDHEGHTLDIHSVPSSFTLKPSAWIRIAQKHLGMTVENASVVIIYDSNDVTTVHGTRYPEFIEHGVTTQIQHGAIPLFWFIENNKRYGRHLYLFIADNQHLLHLLMHVRSREVVENTR